MTSLLPAATTVLAMLASIQPLHFPGYAAVTPAFTLMAVYHWTMHRPQLLPAFALFFIGTVQDLLSGALPGVTALVLLLTRAIVLSQRRHFVKRSFPFIWAGFTLLTGGVMFLLWALHSLLAAQLLDFHSTMFRAVLTISLYPVASLLLGRSQRILLGAS
ncbi:MAG: rod shape-determining protein MreD [Stellaceae bacterium]